jgi:hypothetical protein
MPKNLEECSNKKEHNGHNFRQFILHQFPTCIAYILVVLSEFLNQGVSEIWKVNLVESGKL